MNTKKCPYCGKELPEELHFCRYCMHKLTEEEKPDSPRVNPFHKHKKRLIACLAGAVFVSFGIAAPAGRNKPPAVQRNILADGVHSTKQPSVISGLHTGV